MEYRRVHLLRGYRSRASRFACALAGFRGWRKRNVNVKVSILFYDFIGLRECWVPPTLEGGLGHSAKTFLRHSVSRDEIIKDRAYVPSCSSPDPGSDSVSACRDHVHAVPPAAPRLPCFCLLLPDPKMDRTCTFFIFLLLEQRVSQGVPVYSTRAESLHGPRRIS